ncbi:MAG: S26 family signal peptidase [Planctomycetota bacterium]
MTARPAWHLLRDLIPAAVGAWMVFHVLRTQVAERYAVPSRSMEPTLHGSPRDGDVVLVDKTAFWSIRESKLRRFDLVVVRNRHQPGGSHLVKRFVAEGPAEVAVREGDLFVREGDARTPTRVVRDPLEHEDLWQTSFRLRDPKPGDAALAILHGADRVEDGAVQVAAQTREELFAQLTPDAQNARLSAAEPDRWLRGCVATAKAIDTGFLDADGERLADGRADVRDVGVEIDCACAAGVESLVVVLEVVEIYHAIEYATDGHIRVTTRGAPTGAEVQAPRLEPGTWHRIRVGCLDGRLFLVADGRLLLWVEHEVPFRSPRDLVPLEDRPRPPANAIHIAATGRGAMAVREITGFHDVHWQPRSETYRLEPGEIFVLGDNSYDSSDSRDFASDPFRIEDLVGRPLAVLAPRARMRWL